MKLILLTAIVLTGFFVVGECLLRPNPVQVATAKKRCQWGASFWCQGLDSAMLCGKVDYCQKNVWKKPSIDECKVCEEIVGIAINIMKSNGTEAAAKSAVDDLCDKLGPFASQCKELVDQYFDDIWQMLLGKNVTAEEICTKLGFCGGQMTKLKLSKSSQPLKQGKATFGECDVCEKIVAVALKFVESGTEDAAKAAVDELCNELGPLASTCKGIVNKFFDEIWQLLKQHLTADEICEKLGFCSSINTPVQITVEQLDQEGSGGGECDICEEIVQVALKYLESGSEEAAKAAVDDLCDTLGPLSSICKGLVDEFFDEIWKMLEQHLSAEEICEKLGLCSSANTPVQMEMDIEGSGGGECDICKEIVQVALKYLESGSEEAAKAAVDDLCNKLGPLSSVCKGLVNEFFDEIWKMLQQHLSAEEICEKLGLCSSAKTPIEVTVEQFSENEEGTATVCETCTEVVEKTLDYMGSGSKESHTPEKICKHFGYCQ